jgi:predicted nucleic acid-binding protein
LKYYLDTGVLVKLYYPEEGSESISNWIRAQAASILFTSLHELELKNAFALKVFRSEITPEKQEDVAAMIESDVEKNILQRMQPDWGVVFMETIKHISRCSSKHGTRSLDILHIACAKALGCTSFLSNDERQKECAASTGLELLIV